MRARRGWTEPVIAAAVLAALLLAPEAARAEDFTATPSTLDAQLGMLGPGDTLHLMPGTYEHFTISGMTGTAAMPIVITGPADRSAIVRADDGPCCNTIQIDGDVSYVELHDLTIDGHGVSGAFGVDARGPNVHHVTIDGCLFIGHDADQQTVAISTKTDTAGWVIRNNVISGAGTGMYLGNSDGTDPFVEGLIEHNLFEGTIGYNVQIKWQLPHGAIVGASSSPASTIIRHNVFVKDGRASPDGDRPNLLVGGFPSSGPGSEDRYEIYGNVLAGNPREALLQASGRVSIHDNVFLDTPETAIALRDHDLPLRRAWVYQNTIVVSGTGIGISGDAPEGVHVVGNAIFAGTAITGTPDVNDANVTGALADAATMLRSGASTLGAADPFPRPGMLEGIVIDVAAFASDRDMDLDFDCLPRGARTVRGAYGGDPGGPRWMIRAENKPACGSAPGTDAGVGIDASGIDGGSRDGGGSSIDAGAMTPTASGCACRAGRVGGGGAEGLGLVALALVLRRARRGLRRRDR